LPTFPSRTILPDDDAWREIRARVASAVPVLRPSWLPPKVDGSLAFVYYVRSDVVQGMATYSYRVAYSGPGGSIIEVSRGPTNSAQPLSTEPIEVRGQKGTLSSTSAWPQFEVTWMEAGDQYSIQASGIAREDIIRIATSLREQR
jgi:hypothetical protein